MTTVVCVPLKVDAFVLNTQCVNQYPKSTLAPITQPNYTFLQLDHRFIRSDVLPPVDLHDAGDLASNSRLTDPSKATDNLRDGRIGVYLHWSLPRFYRTGAGMTADASKEAAERETERRAQAGFPQVESNADLQAPNYRAAPNRWLVIRRLKPGDLGPVEARLHVDEFKAWIIQSDKKQNLDSISADVDLQVETTPFVDGTGQLSHQAEVFIGEKNPAAGWKEPDDLKDRVPLSLLSSSNILLADYVPHNGNVFSMLDDMTYNVGGTLKKLEYANVSYQVIGWHQDETLDPFYITPNSGPEVNHASRLQGCNMVFSLEPADEGFKTWLQGTSDSRILCHGTMYGVQYSLNYEEGKGPTSMAEQAAASLVPSSGPSPVTIGTNPLDTMLAYIKAHASDNELYRDIQKISQWLIKQNDDVDSQNEASDLLTAHNFAPARFSGSQWFASGPGANVDGQPPEVSKTFKTALKKLNDLEEALAEAQRDQKQAQQDLFYLWWSHFSRSDNAGISSEIKALAGVIDARNAQMTTWQQQISALSTDPATNPVTAGKVEKRAQDSFYSLRDPTLFISNIQSPWPYDFLKPVKVRLANQLVGPRSFNNNPVWLIEQSLLSGPNSIFTALDDPKMADAAVGLFWEFYNLHPSSVDDSLYPWSPVVPSAGEQLPLYHDSAPGATVLRDYWNNTQPFCPLFLEWEVKYYHIPWEEWEFAPYDEEDLYGNKVTRRKYGVLPSFNTSTLKNTTAEDSRILSGRVLILPQPSFSLAANIQQLFDSLPNDILVQTIGDKDAQDSVVQQASMLPYMSSPLSGFTSHLLTVGQGSHIKPTVRPPGGQLQLLSNARPPDVQPGMLELIDTETQFTPYGLEIPIESATVPPFKPVTHGQFYFTKLCIVDKFGQAISALDPRYSTIEPKVYPTISEFYQPQQLTAPLGSGPNIVTGADTYPNSNNCRCVQIPPDMNQDSRLNARFMTRSTDTVYTPATDWDNPIMGWVVVNYIEEGVQFFLPDGTFYREVRLSQDGATTTHKWAPFDPPESTSSGSADLDAFIASCQTNVQDLIRSINAALDSIPPATSEYAEFMSAIVGRPLALVVTGWSLELATPPLANQSALNVLAPEKKLTDYLFALKIGDGDRVWDGMVGMFTPKADSGDFAATRAIDYTSMYTYFPSGTFAQPVSQPGVSDKFIALKPYKYDPTMQDPTALRALHDSELKVRAILMDPFAPIHGYCGILPIRQLKLPPWSVHNAMRRMTVFFQMGPIVLPTAEPAFETSRQLDPTKTDYLKDMTKLPTIPIPAIQSADWAWLQPYAQGDGASYNAVGIGSTDSRPRYEKGPYVAVEGYMQLRQPLEAVAQHQ